MKHFVFDLDGTLIDSHKPYFRALQKTFEHFNIDFSKLDRNLARKLFAPDLLMNYISESQHSAAVEFLAKTNREMIPEIKVFPGIFELLDLIDGRNRDISIWTARDKSSAEELLKFTGLSEYLTHFRSKSCVINNKPHPEALLSIIENSPQETHEFIMIGDTDFDMMGAKSARVKSIGVSWNNPVDQDISHLADHHFFRVEDLLNWLKNHPEFLD